VQPADPRDRRIEQLEAALAERDALIDKLMARMEALEAKVASLSRDSTNSSKPPSGDPPSTTRPASKSTGKKRGGQPGHQGHQRQLLPSEQVNRTVDVLPDVCDCCGARLHGRDHDPLRHQVIDIPPLKPDVTEFRLHALGCACGAVTRAQLPAGVPHGAFGPRLSAMLSVCTAKYRLSKRAVRELLADFLGVELSLGSVSNVEQQVSSALDAPVAEAAECVQHSIEVNADETSWREDKKKAWLWVAATATLTVFMVATSRGSKVAKALLGEAFKGVLTTDRWAAYNWLNVSLRQICWAHLKRDFQSWVDGGGPGGKLGIELLRETRRMFRLWHRARDGTLTREQLAKKMRPVQLHVATLLTAASVCRTRRVRGMAKEMLKLEWAFWTFIDTPGVEPTNNFAERQIRHAVLWRKGCFGTDSPAGSRFVERMLTTITSLRLQKRNVLEFITAACSAQLTGAPAPSLIPGQAHVTLAAA
jgi:transposase